MVGWSIIRGVRVTPQQRSLFAAGISRGMSATAIINSLRGTTEAIRREVGLALYRELTGAAERGRALSSIRRDYRPSERMVQQSSQLMSTRYRVYGAVRAITSEGYERLISVNFGTDSLLTRGEMEDEIARIGGAAVEAYDLRMVGVELQAIYRSREE